MASADKGGGKPWDGALGAVSKQLDEASKSVRDAAAGPVDQAKELSSSARHALHESAQQAWEVARTFVAPVVDVFQRAEGAEGTELRKQLGVVRESFNAQLYAAQQQLQETRKIADGQLVPVKGALVVAQQQLVKANEFRREHPEVAAAGLAVVVGVPSLLIRGKWSAVRNSVLAVGAGAAACYGSDKWAEKKRK
ncbi:hypothetical protein PF005_g9451 [Phytophthora fragariae]|uniref:Uncharacterized protein n=1 Tax=Phytophthora fragariae TaxID=53985 RepID=A0A6A3F2K8_9STRA|nr:hypothetical protein PF003_g23756 [Phytophthora fragariae]KAE8939649.1 hypothetical protein PF009_g10516 [Phytophthora fragariae]KAE9013536.1 hypothetical protein PF011_g8442 [Phytophthora fragariae]KAE9116609.1 hypothetical protein PF010_g8904 [Phytophthora fragariae]KAE9116678.1 hypothetical protein PF007_g9580 [Phytophthora fragariae]